MMEVGGGGNRAVKWGVAWVLLYSTRLVSEGVKTEWYYRQTLLPSVHIDYSYDWLHGQAILLHSFFISSMTILS